MSGGVEYAFTFLFFGERKMDIELLISKALEGRKKSYAPYSNFAVGAALLTNSGEIIQGCNVENASYGATNCAERTAIFKAVSEGFVNFKAIAIVGGKTGAPVENYAYPCGVCRQVMREFTNPEEFIVIVAKNEKDYKEYRLSELLPESFGPENL